MKLQILFLLFLVYVSIAGPVRDNRIVEGYDAVDGQFPFMVSIQHFWNMDHWCGGSIISERWVLSAAHCLHPEFWQPQSTRIVAGSVFLRGGVNAHTHGVSKIIQHPQYVPLQYGYDIAILQVTHPFIFSRFIQPIRLGSEFVEGGLWGNALGWGLTTHNATGDPSHTLQWINQFTLTHQQCYDIYAPRQFFILPSHLCSFSRLGQGICYHDSGGPFVVNNAAVGIASFHQPCGVGWPDGWDRVSSHIRWIMENAVG